MPATVKAPQSSSSPLTMNFSWFPKLAKFIREHHLRAYVEDQINTSREVGLPILSFFSSLTHEQLVERSIVSSGEFLKAVEENRLDEHLAASIRNWKADQMEGLGRDDVMAEDITLISFIRKKALTSFVQLFTNEPAVIIEIIREIDLFSVINDSAITNTYIDILNERISQHVHFIERVTNTSPGIIYVYDLVEGKEIYSNRSIADFLGYTQEVIHALGQWNTEYLIHPEDKITIIENNRSFSIAQDGDIRSVEYRMRNKQGSYIWLRAYESVFKRAGDGAVLQKIGIATNINDQKNAETELKHSEAKLLEAQEIAELGSFEWDLTNGAIQVTPKGMEILDLDKTGDMAEFMSRVHAYDRPRVKQAMDEALAGAGLYECEYRLYTRDNRERIIWSKGVVSFKEGKPTNFSGTIMNVTERHHMVQRLQRSEELYKQAQARTHIGNWTWDIEHNQVTWSDEMYRVYGLEPQSEKISFERYLSFIHPDERAARKSEVYKLLESHIPTETHFRVVLDNGETKILQSKSEVLLDEEGKPFKMIGTCQDVTDRQTLIERLQRSEHLYKQAQAMSHIGNWSLNMSDRSLTWSDEMYRIYGLKPQSEISYDLIARFNHPDDAARVAEEVEKAAASHSCYDFIYRIVLHSGEVKTVHAIGTMTIDESGNIKEVNGTLQDVTERQKTEQLLRENREFIQKIANTTPSLIAAYNVRTGEYIFINKALEKILGYDPDEVIINGVEFFTGIIHPEDLQPLMEKNSAALKAANENPPVDGDEMVVEFKYRMRHKKGGYRWFHTYGTIFDRNNTGQVEHVLNVSVDITEQEEAERMLSQRNLELQQSNASLEEYAYVASHDLKEPLRKISTFSDRLLSSLGDDIREDGKSYLKKIIESSMRMQGMINDLLSVSTISGNKAFEKYDLNLVLREVLQALEYKIEEKKAVITADNLPAVAIVPSQMRQLFQNLLSNSLKFAKSDQIPEVHISHKFRFPKDMAGYGLLKASKYLEISFTDNGIGFDNQFANKIFTIFQRLHGKSEYEGTGIGLAICKKIVENHGGVISASGVPNEGAVFTIIIPL